jgi:leucine-zipper of insertion element IS481
MKLHANAGLSLKGRELLIDRVLSEGWSLARVAEAAGISERTACKWVARFRSEGDGVAALLVCICGLRIKRCLSCNDVTRLYSAAGAVD